MSLSLTRYNGGCFHCQVCTVDETACDILNKAYHHRQYQQRAEEEKSDDEGGHKSGLAENKLPRSHVKGKGAANDTVSI